MDEILNELLMDGGTSVPPNANGAAFTLPAIQLPDGSYLMDSYKIADFIEEKHPEPSVLLNTPVQLRYRKILIDFMEQLTPIYVPGVAQRLLGEKSLEYFHITRQKDVGMPLDEYQKKHGPGAFERAEPFAREMTALLNETSGPYFLGNTVSYTDFMWAAILLFWKTLGDDTFQKVLKITGDAEKHTNLLDALSPWTERND